MIKSSLTVLATLLTVACASTTTGGRTANATLNPTTGNSVSGSVVFTQQGDAVQVAGEVRGLKPNGVHGFHIHEKGDCSSGDGMGTGGHFNPTGTAHGAHNHGTHHAGDLVSLTADASGVARFSYLSSTIAVGTGAADIIGRGLIVHRDADDFATQPTGNSGPRVACAVIVKG
jgi:Cu-Zn family superoxide dismutase